MELKGAIEPTIGPYEVYEDEWFNYKAASSPTSPSRTKAKARSCRNFPSSYRTSRTISRSIPKYRNPKIGALSPIVVVNEIFCAGDANHGVQTAAFNLPNDERVTREKGSKRVMLKNVQDAKFAKTLVPISKVVLSPADQKDLSFDAFFTHIVVHELMHGLGPHDVTTNGRKSTVREELKEAYSALEEAKADISGLFAIQYMIDKGVLEKSHGAPALHDLSRLQLSAPCVSERAKRTGSAWRCSSIICSTRAASSRTRTAPFRLITDKIKAGVEGLTREIMTIQAEGNYEKAKDLTDATRSR